MFAKRTSGEIILLAALALERREVSAYRVWSEDQRLAFARQPPMKSAIDVPVHSVEGTCDSNTGPATRSWLADIRIRVEHQSLARKDAQTGDSSSGPPPRSAKSSIGLESRFWHWASERHHLTSSHWSWVGGRPRWLSHSLNVVQRSDHLFSWRRPIHSCRSVYPPSFRSVHRVEMSS